MVEIVDYTEAWPADFRQIGERLREALGSTAIRIDHIGWWIQPVNATRSLNISAGVWKPSVLRGLWFNCRAIAFS